MAPCLILVIIFAASPLVKRERSGAGFPSTADLARLYQREETNFFWDSVAGLYLHLAVRNNLYIVSIAIKLRREGDHVTYPAASGPLITFAFAYVSQARMASLKFLA